MTTTITEPGLLGEAIQDYVRRKWKLAARPNSQGGRNLPETVKQRIDALGIDDKLLLAVQPKEVLDRMTELESEAFREDIGVSSPVDPEILPRKNG